MAEWLNVMCTVHMDIYQSKFGTVSCTFGAQVNLPELQNTTAQGKGAL